MKSTSWSDKPLSKVTILFSAMAFSVATVPCHKAHAANGFCTYETWDWDATQRKAVNFRKVKKPASELTSEERGDVAGCTVCREDQGEVRIGSLAPFLVCKNFEERIRRGIAQAIADGFAIETITGYRPGKSKGPLNAVGQRTLFSNHSFGTAIDFNPAKNGLYDFCVVFGPACKLIRGGTYSVGVSGTVTADSALYRAMKKEGFKWGGEIAGKQKDFMHFSLTGY
jgi:hypothetical protein